MGAGGTPLPIPTTPDPSQVPTQAGPVDPSRMQKLQRFMQALSKTMTAAGQKFGQGGGGVGAQTFPGRVGTAPASLVGGSPGFPQINAPGGAGPQGVPIPTSQPSPASLPDRVGFPMPEGALQTGFEFQTPKAARAASTFQVFQGLTQIADEVEQRVYNKKKQQAERYITELNDARNQGRWQDYYNLVNDKDVQKVLKAVAGYTKKEFERMGSQEKAPPEVAGAQSAAQRQVQGGQQRQKQPQAGSAGLHPSTTQQTQAMIDQARQKTLQQDPTALRAAALGTTLSGDEMKQAEQIGAGLQVSPAALAAMSAEDRKIALQTKTEIDSVNLEVAARIQSALIAKASDADVAKIRLQGTKDIRSSMEKIASGRADSFAVQAFKTQDTNLVRMITNLRSTAARFQASGDSLSKTDPDAAKQSYALAKQYAQEADDEEAQRTSLSDMMARKQLEGLGMLQSVE